jgi:hypothetical protein
VGSIAVFEAIGVAVFKSTAGVVGATGIDTGVAAIFSKSTGAECIVSTILDVGAICSCIIKGS